MKSSTQITLTALVDIPLVRLGDNLVDIIEHSLRQSDILLYEGDVLVIAHKIVSKVEGRYVDLCQIQPTQRACTLAIEVEKDPRLVEVILSESSEVVRYRPGVLVVAHRLGFVLANAGVDSSNVDQESGSEQVLLLPKDPDGTCAEIRQQLKENSGSEVGVIINDSHGRAWRNGTVGVALGVAGVPALLDLRGEPDLYDERLEVTQVGLADELAAAASILMGQGNEGQPIVHIRGLPYPLRAGIATDLLRSKREDLFR
ncbi:MAG: coenzyme F420-0:L-glutamate ligase [Anaerolineales bacterium]|nr:coenzyme F420-0:L-glutamate ligase [Anaerolineales bacterium]